MPIVQRDRHGRGGLSLKAHSSQDRRRAATRMNLAGTRRPFPPGAPIAPRPGANRGIPGTIGGLEGIAKRMICRPGCERNFSGSLPGRLPVYERKRPPRRTASALIGVRPAVRDIIPSCTSNGSEGTPVPRAPPARAVPRRRYRVHWPRLDAADDLERDPCAFAFVSN